MTNETNRPPTAGHRQIHFLYSQCCCTSPGVKLNDELKHLAHDVCPLLLSKIIRIYPNKSTFTLQRSHHHSDAECLPDNV